MKPVLYNPGGYVAYVSVKIAAPDSFEAFVEAAHIAHAYEGRVERLYEDASSGQRSRIGGVERAGLVLEYGALDDADRLSFAVKTLREERSAVKRGRYAQALDLAIALLDPPEDEKGNP